MASAIGTALIPTQGSCLPFVRIVVVLLFLSTVFPVINMLEVGFSAMSI